MHGYRTNTEYTGSLGYKSVIRTHLDLILHLGSDGFHLRGFLGIDIDVILANCTMPFVIHTYLRKDHYCIPY